MSLAEKLDPRRFTAMSGKMAAIVGYIVDAHDVWITSPAIIGLVVTSSGGVLAATDEDPLFDEFIGHESDLRRNWTTLLDVAGLNAFERELAEHLYRQRVRHA